MTASHPSALQAFCAAGLWPGVGDSTATSMSDAGMATAADITEEALAALPGVGAKRAKRLFTAWLKAAPAFDVATLLAPHGLPIRWSRRLVESLGDNAAELLTGDPWSLLAVSEAEVHDADRLARAWDPAVESADPRRGRALVARILTRQARSGHTVTPLPAVAADLAQFGVRPAGAITAAIPRRLATHGSSAWWTSPAKTVRRPWRCGSSPTRRRVSPVTCTACAPPLGRSAPTIS